MPTTFVLFANSRTNPTEFFLGREVPQQNGLVTIERTYEADEPQPDGTTKPSVVLSIQENGDFGWRPRGTNGPFEVAQKAQGFYLYAPTTRLRGDLKAPVYAVARFEEFTL